MYILTSRANKKVNNMSLLMEMNLHLGPLHSVCTFTQGHKHVIPVSPVKYRPRHPKDHHFLWMMKVHVADLFCALLVFRLLHICCHVMCCCTCSFIRMIIFKQSITLLTLYGPFHHGLTDGFNRSNYRLTDASRLTLRRDNFRTAESASIFFS